jgi:predicted small lipoprotein YifL
MTTGPWIKTICAVALMSAVLTGCGRKGPLERPAVTPVPAAASAEELQAPATPERRFILDSLLD